MLPSINAWNIKNSTVLSRVYLVAAAGKETCPVQVGDIWRIHVGSVSQASSVFNGKEQDFEPGSAAHVPAVVILGLTIHGKQLCITAVLVHVIPAASPDASCSVSLWTSLVWQDSQFNPALLQKCVGTVLDDISSGIIGGSYCASARMAIRYMMLLGIHRPWCVLTWFSPPDCPAFF